MKDLKPYRINAMLNYNRTQRIVLVEIRPGNMAPNTYTLFSKDKAAMYVFRKEDGEWHQQYGRAFEADQFTAIKQMLEEIDKEIFAK
ncbi:hypothetical protein [Sphingobacterium spiritivorum]|uniref:hypothetical protein n=1 Tax=Sphingobacterium spiritivorum TaxID=258 RepID=UPI001918B6D6|nr:hypothetical protein [Sphingobacterium spiritivorum]QQT26807.1 hypothetical protein I6J02_02785 [Sphingobacterium spiritivorum]